MDFTIKLPGLLQLLQRQAGRHLSPWKWPTNGNRNGNRNRKQFFVVHPWRYRMMGLWCWCWVVVWNMKLSNQWVRLWDVSWMVTINRLICLGGEPSSFAKKLRYYPWKSRFGKKNIVEILHTVGAKEHWTLPNKYGICLQAHCKHDQIDYQDYPLLYLSLPSLFVSFQATSFPA